MLFIKDLSREGDVTKHRKKKNLEKSPNNTERQKNKKAFNILLAINYMLEDRAINSFLKFLKKITEHPIRNKKYGKKKIEFLLLGAVILYFIWI